MKKFSAALVLAIAGGSIGCGHYTERAASGDVIDPADAAKTVVLHVKNQNPVSMELRTIVSGRTQFIGSVSGSDSTDILLDPSIFPTGSLYFVAVPADGHGRAIVGPVQAVKGDKVIMTVEELLSTSHAIVVR